MAGIATAGVGAVAREIKSRKERRKSNDIENNKNVIVVPVKKSKFMEGLPTPEELSAARGEKTKSDTPLLSEPKAVPLLPAPDGQGSGNNAELSADDLAAKKREILKSRARSVDFFGKRASDQKAKEDEDKGKDGDKSDLSDATEDRSDGSDHDDSKKEDGRILLRDQSGKFVSPTNPVGVVQVEKVADFSEWLSWAGNTIAHPIDTIGKIVNAAKDRPVAYTAGAVGSIYLAAKISDAINKRRRAKAKERLEDAREEYVSLIDGDNEKTAQDPNGMIGTAIGTAFFVPMAITALVTNRIIENRKAEKKRAKQMSDSYPDEPIILYKTSEDKEFEIMPETALALMLIKKAMIEDAERLDVGCGTEKRAIFGWNSATEEDAVNTAIDVFNDPKNHKLVLDLAQAYADNDRSKIDAAYKALSQNAYVKDKFSKWWTGQSKIISSPEFRSRLVNSSKFQDALAYKMNNDKDFIGIRDGMIDDYLGRTFTKGGILHTILSWIAKHTGIGSYYVNKAMRNGMSGLANGNVGGSATQGSGTGAQQAQTAPTDPSQGTLADPTSIGGERDFYGNYTGGGNQGGIAAPSVPATGNPGTTNAGAERMKNPFDHFKKMNPAYGWGRIANGMFNTKYN